MSVYVDELREHDTKLRWKVWCHMTADTDEELHEMADKIGHKREWYQPHPRGNHYDLTPSRRKLAIKHGAIEEHSRTRVRRLRAENPQKEEPGHNSHMLLQAKIPGVQVVYADDLASVKMDPSNYHRLIHQSEYMAQPMSKRIEWVEKIAKEANEGADIWIVTNDYYFIRLLGFFCHKDKFTIHCENGTTVHRFVDIHPNPTLKLGEYVFIISAREGLKRDK